jgi:hypothetical protein
VLPSPNVARVRSVRVCDAQPQSLMKDINAMNSSTRLTITKCSPLLATVLVVLALPLSSIAQQSPHPPTSPLARVRVARQTDSGIITVCPATPLTNCEVRYHGANTYRWAVAAISPSRQCARTDSVIRSCNSPRPAYGSDATLCLMHRGTFVPRDSTPVNSTAQVPPNHIVVQCDQGRAEVTVAPSPPIQIPEPWLR